MDAKFVSKIVIENVPITESGTYLESFGCRFYLSKSDLQSFYITKNIRAIKASNPDESSIEEPYKKQMNILRSSAIVDTFEISTLVYEHLLTLKENQLKFQLTKKNNSIYLEECDKINTINEVLKTEFKNIIIHLNAKKPSNIRQSWVNEYIKFLHMNDLKIIQKIFPEIFQNLYKNSIDLEIIPEDHKNSFFVFKFKYLIPKCEDILIDIKLRYENHLFDFEAEILFICKDVHLKLKKYSKILENLRKQALKVNSLDSFKKISFKLKSFRLGTDSYEIYKEIKYFLVYYQNELIEISRDIKYIWNDQNIQEKKTNRSIKLLLKGSEILSSIFLMPYQQLEPENLILIIEQSFIIKLNFYFLIIDLCESLLSKGLCLKTSNSIFISFKITNLEQIDEKTVKTNNMTLSQIFITPNLGIKYIEENWISILSLIPENFNKKSYLNEMHNFLINSLKLPIHQELYNKDLTSNYSILSYPCSYARSLYSIYSNFSIRKMVKYLEFIEEKDKISILIESPISLKPKRDLIEFLLKDLFEVIKELAIYCPHVLSIDFSCLFMNKKGKLIVMIKPLEEIDDFYKAPEVLSGRNNNESILYSYGKIIDTMYFKNFKKSYSSMVPLQLLNDNEKKLKALVIELNKASIIERASLGELDKTLMQILM